MDTEERLAWLEREARRGDRYEEIEKRLAVLEARVVTWRSVAWVAVGFAVLSVWHSFKG